MTGMLAAGTTGSAPGSPQDAKGEVYGLAMRFQVKVDQFPLGRWASCSGLGVTFKPDELVQPGDYASHIYLPGEISYGEVTLTRAMQADASREVQRFLEKVVREWDNWDGQDFGYQGTAVTITLLDSQGAHPVASWTLANAVPKSWAGPELSGRSNEVAVEKLQFVHSGFLSRKNGEGQ